MQNDDQQPIEFSEWLQLRIGHFTASEVHKLFVGSKKKGEIFGQGAMTYIRTKAAELLTMTSREEMDFKQVNWGTEHEFSAYQQFEKVTGLRGEYYGKHNPKFFTDGEHVGCSPDWEGVYIGFDENDPHTIGADFKAPWNTSEHLLNLQLESADQYKDVRWEYYCQQQHGILIRKWHHSHFVSYDPRMIEERLRLKIIEVYPDMAWQQEYKERVTAAIDILGNMINI